jgi:hypothetical protein
MEAIKMNKILIVIPLIIIIAISGTVVLLTYHAPTNNGTPNETSNPSTNPNTSPSQTTTQVRYKTVDFVDSQGIGTKAFSMLIPVDWQSSGEIKWVLDNPAMPAFGSFKAWNPNGEEEYNYLQTKHSSHQTTP